MSLVKLLIIGGELHIGERYTIMARFNGPNLMSLSEVISMFFCLFCEIYSIIALTELS